MTIEFGEVNRYDQASTFPAVDLIFTGPKKSLVDRVSGKSLQFTRNTIGTYVDANGIIQTAAAGEPRYTYDPATGEELGLMVEEDRTNLLPYSDYSVVEGTTDAQLNGVVLAPDGTISARRYSFPSDGLNTINKTYTSATVGLDYTFSVWIRSTGTPTQVLLTAGDPPVNQIIQITTSWQRYSITKVSNGSNLVRGYVLLITVGDEIDVWGAQLEAGTFPTSYIPTTSSTVTRDPDTVTLTNDNLYNNSQFDIINDPFGMSSGSNTLTLLPSNSENSAIKRATIFSPNITQNNINSFAGKTDEFWRWRVRGNSVELPIARLNGSGATLDIDWGDGTIENYSPQVGFSHTYTDGKEYHEIGFKINGDGSFQPSIYNEPGKEKIIAVGPAPESMKFSGQQAFWGCSNLTAFDATVVAADSFSRAWQDCTNLTSFPLLDTSSGVDFNQTWFNCSSLTRFPLLDTSSGTTFNTTWRDCSSLTSFPLLNTSSGTTFTQTWFNCNSLTSFPLLDTSSGITFNSTWRGCSSLTSFPLLNTSSGTAFTQTWQYCSSLTSFPLLDTSSGTLFSNTWDGCNSLTSFPSLNLSSGTNFNSAWRDCNSLVSFPLLDTSSGVDFNAAWRNCSSLTSFPLLNTSSGVDFNAAWLGCNSLTSFPSLNTSSGTIFYYAWYACSNLTSFPSLNLSSGTNFGYAWAFCNILSDFPANMFDSWASTPTGSCFVNAWYSCSSLTSTSVENILNSISVSAASGTPPASGTDITIDYNAVSGIPDITVAAIDLTAKGWVPTLNGSAKTDPYSDEFVTLDLDFATNKTLVDNVSGNNLITFTRNSTATYVDNNGIIQTAAVDTARFDHDPVTGESLGLLIEESRTNLFQYSTDFSQGYWAKTRSTLTANTTTSPDGTTTASTLTVSTGSSYSYMLSSISTANGTSYSLSYWVKYNNCQYVWLLGAEQLNVFAYFDLINGVVGAANGYNCSITSYPDGWYRITATRTKAGATAIEEIAIGITRSSTSPTNNQVGDAVYVWGAQFETGTFPTSYIPTSGSTVTRAADVASITGTNFSSWYNQSEGTMFVDIQNAKSSSNAGGYPRVLSGETFDSAFMQLYPTKTVYGTFDGTVAMGVPVSTVGYGTSKLANAWKISDSSNTFAASGVINTGTTYRFDNQTKLVFGTLNYAAINGHLSRLTYWPKRLTDTSLQYLTQ